MKTTTIFSFLIGLVITSNLFASGSLRIEITKSDITCFGQTNGKAALYITGGVEPYRIEWNNGQTESSIEQLKKGKYVVTVTDAKGDQQTDSVEICMPKPLMVSYNTPMQTSVDNFNAKMDISILGGTPWSSITDQTMYFIRIDGKSYYANPELIADGKHVMSIEDAQGCKLNFDVKINVHLVGEQTQELHSTFDGMGTIDMTVYPVHLASNASAPQAFN